MRQLVTWIAFACIAALPQSASAQAWLVEDASGLPGETVPIRISFRSDGHVIAATTTVLLSPFLSAVPGFHAGDVGICEGSGSGGAFRVESSMGATTPGEVVHVCTVLVRVQPTYRRTVGLRAAAGMCMDRTSAMSPCIAGESRFAILGEAWPFQRSLLIVPHAAPRGPSPEQLVFFDWSDATTAAPLSGAESPRPQYVRSVFADEPWYGQAPPPPAVYSVMDGVPNPAAAALTRSVRATYADEAERQQAFDRLRSDPDVLDVVQQAPGTQFVYPVQPVAGQPFALWFWTSVCGNYTPSSYDDRIVRVEGNVVRVHVPERGQQMCGVPPPGTIHHVLNMPALPAGTYSLEVHGYYATPGDGYPSLADPMQITVRGGVVVAAPSVVPATGLPMLVLLVSGLALVAARRSR